MPSNSHARPPRRATSFSFRGERVYDGSLGGPGPGWLPCPPGVGYCIRVSSMPPGIKIRELLVNDVLLSPQHHARAGEIVAMR